MRTLLLSAAVSLTIALLGTPVAIRFFVRHGVGQEIQDDHLPLNNAGIPTIDIIDFNYPYWHKAGDLPDKCSGASLAQVGKVVTAWLAQPKPKPRRR